MLAGPDWLKNTAAWIQIQVGHGFSVGWTNGRYAVRLISRTITEGPPVSSLNCDRPLHSGIRVPEL